MPIDSRVLHGWRSNFTPTSSAGNQDICRSLQFLATFTIYGGCVHSLGRESFVKMR